jgi:hypothetical protein
VRFSARIFEIHSESPTQVWGRGFARLLALLAILGSDCLTACRNQACRRCAPGIGPAAILLVEAPGGQKRACSDSARTAKRLKRAREKVARGPGNNESYITHRGCYHLGGWSLCFGLSEFCDKSPSLRKSVRLSAIGPLDRGRYNRNCLGTGGWSGKGARVRRRFSVPPSASA